MHLTTYSNNQRNNKWACSNLIMTFASCPIYVNDINHILPFFDIQPNNIPKACADYVFSSTLAIQMHFWHFSQNFNKNLPLSPQLFYRFLLHNFFVDCKQMNKKMNVELECWKILYWSEVGLFSLSFTWKGDFMEAKTCIGCFIAMAQWTCKQKMGSLWYSSSQIYKRWVVLSLVFIKGDDNTILLQTLKWCTNKHWNPLLGICLCGGGTRWASSSLGPRSCHVHVNPKGSRT